MTAHPLDIPTFLDRRLSAAERDAAFAPLRAHYAARAPSRPASRSPSQVAEDRDKLARAQIEAEQAERKRNRAYRSLGKMHAKRTAKEAIRAGARWCPNTCQWVNP